MPHLDLPTMKYCLGFLVTLKGLLAFLPVLWLCFSFVYVMYIALWVTFNSGRRMPKAMGMKYRVVKVGGRNWYTAQQKHSLWPYWVKCDISNIHDTELAAWIWLYHWLEGDKPVTCEFDRRHVKDAIIEAHSLEQERHGFAEFQDDEVLEEAGIEVKSSEKV